ncbi:MAG: Cna B-type domain-containing protein [Oscillospiraceae bacterium]|nr:Cna B-type domain-containing protein [Oscillospiraceae bacterium]
MNKMKRQLHRVIALLLGCVLLCCPAFAAEASCSLRVNIADEQHEPVGRFHVELAPITVMDGGTHTLLPEYEALGITAAELAALDPRQAETVYQYIRAMDIPGHMVTTNAYGVANFGALAEGIYLVYDRGDQVFTFPPYLVSLPAETPEGLIYHLNSEPKTVSVDSHTIQVAIEWDDNDNAAGRRPEGVEVTLLRDNTMLLRAAASNGEATPYRSVVLNEVCLWQHTFLMLPHGSTYSVSGGTVPHYTLVEIEENMEGFVLYYQYTPSTDPTPPGPTPPGPTGPSTPGTTTPTLPQTGFRMLPVYLLLGLGTVMVLAGMADLCVKKETV